MFMQNFGFVIHSLQHVERLWSSLDRIALDPRDAMPRLRHFRCLLNQRGIAAAPVEGYGRSTPFGPGSCYSQ